MKSTTVKFNPSNWTDDEASVKIFEDNSFELHGYTFQLVEGESTMEDFDTYNIVGDDWQHPLGAVSKFKKDHYWMAMGCDMTRENVNPIIAACQLISNLV
jgi:hypothetical protein